MKYAIVVTNMSGKHTGATFKAGSLQEAWQKLLRVIPTDHIQAVEITEIRTSECEIK